MCSIPYAIDHLAHMGGEVCWPKSSQHLTLMTSLDISQVGFLLESRMPVSVLIVFAYSSEAGFKQDSRSFTSPSLHLITTLDSSSIRAPCTIKLMMN